MTTRTEELERERHPIRKVAKLLGPGFITGAADDDPSGVGTYAVAGASLGLQTLWTSVVTFPCMTAVQSICARLGLVSGTGLAGILKEHYPRWVLYPAVAAVVIANTVNVGADLGAIADAAGILIGAPVPWFVVPIALGLLALEIFASYRIIERTFKLLTLALLAYVVDAFLVHPDLGETLRATFVPTISFERDYIATLVAIFGTTISPYLFFWQTSQEVEEEKVAGRRTREERLGASPAELRVATIDVTVGMFVSNLVMYFIILATALTLHAYGQTNIDTGADAAQALRPLAGDLAGAVFAAGMIGTGLLAVPVLSGASAYAVSETFGWPEGLDERWQRAKPFYGVVALATLVGLVIPFTGVKPIDALFFTAILNGITAPPLLVLIMLAARNKKVMGEQTIGPVLTALGWIVTVAMFLALAGLVVTSLGR
ncbi:MAG TPA: Nramp family divalent metal transporter [Candidatus Limnocylindria bacterium]|nr:Nramp family divalent metal transporter [Candidatus Limnocylindria bacterium]